MSLCQFYTTNYEIILKNMSIPTNIKIIIEPFAGKCDLLKFIDYYLKPSVKNKYQLELYDIEPKDKRIIKRDTLINPPNYDFKFVLTNPPYLARNKNKNKKIYDLYNSDDLYKCFIINLIESNCLGGIIIIPVNFLCSYRKKDIMLRKNFIEKYNLILINIFENNENKQLGLKMVKDEDIFIDNTKNLSSRSYASLVIYYYNHNEICEPSVRGNAKKLNLKQQEKLVEMFNKFIKEKREKYNSLFLSNYRDNNRKRITFDLAFKICIFILNFNLKNDEMY